MLLISEPLPNDTKFTTDTPKTFHRLVNQPLDVDSVCISSEEFIHYACKSNSTAYYGQIVSVNYDPVCNPISGYAKPAPIPTMVIGKGYAKPLIDLQTVYDDITMKTYLLVYYKSKFHKTTNSNAITPNSICLSGSSTYYSILPLADLFANKAFRLQFSVCLGYDTFKNPTHIFEQDMLSMFNTSKYNHNGVNKKGSITYMHKRLYPETYGSLVSVNNMFSMAGIGASIIPLDTAPADNIEIKIYLDITDYMSGIQRGEPRDSYNGGFEEWLKKVQK